MSLIELNGFMGGLDDVEVLYNDIEGDEYGVTVKKTDCTLHECNGRVLLYGGCPDNSTNARVLHHVGDVDLLGQVEDAQVDTIGFVHGSSSGFPSNWRIKARRDLGGPNPTPTDPAYSFSSCTDLNLDLEFNSTTREGLVLAGCSRVVAHVKFHNASTGTATTYDAISLTGIGSKFTFYGQVTMHTSGNRQRYGINVATTCTLVHNFMGPLEGVTAGINDPGANVTSH